MHKIIGLVDGMWRRGLRDECWVLGAGFTNPDTQQPALLFDTLAAHG
jgi:hypothetical protein